MLKVTKNQGFTLSLEDTFLNTAQERSQIYLPHPSVSGLSIIMHKTKSQWFKNVLSL